MKFGRYLEENLTPEWRRAYIDYKGCKKRIKIVDQRLRNRSPVALEGGGSAGGKGGEGEGSGGDSSDNDLDHGPAAPPKRRTPSLRAGPGSGAKGSPSTPRSREGPARSPATSTTTPNYGSTTLSPRSIHRTGQPSNPPPLDIGEASVPSSSSSTNIPIKSRLQSVAFAPASPSSPHGHNAALSKSPEEMEEDLEMAARTQSQGQGRERMQSGESDMSGMTGATDTPLTKPMSPNVLGRQQSRSWKSPRLGLGGIRSEPTPKMPGQSPRMGSRSIRSMTLPSPFLPARAAATFSELYETLEPDEKDFFDFLEREMEKVNSFYLARQEDAIRRGKELQEQLTELAEHRKLYHEVYPDTMPKWETAVERFIPGGSATAHATVTGVANAAQKLQHRLPNGITIGGKAEDARKRDIEGQNGNGEANGRGGGGSDFLSERDRKQFSADRYNKYKHELRKATLEYYRNLEIIKNYRILNVTGFRKALKKFEKTTRIHCLESFTEERISTEAFAKGEVIEKMLKNVEQLFTEHFEHGDVKKARERLRKQDYVATHYTSVFRSGVMLGVGFPIAIISIVQALRVQTEEAIDSWQALLQVYAGLFLPVIFALLFELNLDAFVSARINYEFVMELSRPVLDFRSYMEIPAFLFLTLSVCMYFSFFRIGAENVAPTTWPAAWLVFVAAFFLNPLPMVRRRARFWFLRVLWRVITPGWSRVEFIAFFVADELNSLAYSLSNILFLSCAYANRWPDNLYTVCPSGAEWPYILVLAAPAIIRLIQCLKRYFDSALKIHLINEAQSPMESLLAGLWLRPSVQDIIVHGTSLLIGLCCVLGLVGCAKIVGTLALLQVYYFAMVTNFLIRFVFVWYIPDRAYRTRLRSFFFALAEMLRRWQWNFFRVETEHLGNADAYRVTREIPLPYRRLDPDSEEEAEMAQQNQSVTMRWTKLKAHLLHTSRSRSKNDAGAGGSGGLIGKGRGPDELDAGPRGRQGTREYEARRPGDEVQEGDDEGRRIPIPDEERMVGCAGDNGWDGLLRRIRGMKPDQVKNGEGHQV